MVKICLSDYKPVQFKTNQLVIKSGGYLSNKDCPLITKDVKLDGSSTVATFIWIKTRESWLAQAVMGKSMRGEMFAGVLNDLQEAIKSAEARIRTGRLSEQSHIDADEDDPMNEMEVETAESLRINQQRRRGNKKGLPFIKQVCRIAMTQWPPEMTLGSRNFERMVTVYLEGNSKIWLYQDDLDWLVQSLYIQQQVKGVAAVPDDDQGPDAHDSMEDPVTPVKCRQPPKCEGNLHDKWSMAP